MIIMLKKRNAQGLSITVIIAAVIGLIIIVVVVMMLTGKLGAFGKGVDEQSNIAKTCSEQGGSIESGTACSSGSKIFASDTIASGKICCKSVGSPAPSSPACAGEGGYCGAIACCPGLRCDEFDETCY